MSAEVAARITTDAMKDVASTAMSMMQFQQQERIQRADITNNIIRTAQDAKQADIDNFFKSEDLKLRAKALEIGALETRSKMLLDTADLGISRMNANANLMRAEQYARDAEKADGYKDYTTSLFKEAAVLEKSYKTELDAINSDIEDFTVRLYGKKATADSEAIPGMSQHEIYKDKQNPDGIFNKLQKRKSEAKSDLLAKKRERLELLMKEANAVSNGASPGVFIPLPNKSSGPEPQMPMRNGSSSINTRQPDDSAASSALFPPESISGGIKEIDAEIFRTEEALKAYGGNDTLIGQQPSPDNFQATIPFRPEEDITKEKDAEVMSLMLDKNTSLEEIPLFINELSPKGKQDIAVKKQVFENGFLLDYGIKKNYSFNTPYSSKDEASSHLSEKFMRHGGSAVEMVNMQNEAEQKLADLHVSAITSMPEAGEAEISKYIRSEYTKWVASRNKTATETAASNKDDSIAAGSILNIDGSIIGAGDRKAKSSNEKFDIASVFKEPDDSNVKRDSDKAKMKDFSSKFMTNEGRTIGERFNKVLFAKFVKELPYSEKIKLVPIENVSFDSGAPVNGPIDDAELVKKISNISISEAYSIWASNNK